MVVGAMVFSNCFVHYLQIGVDAAVLNIAYLNKARRYGIGL